MSGDFGKVWNDFFAERTRPLIDRFEGLFRAVVVETNDPLRMRRVRFKIPELHDWDLKPELCPWAVPSVDMGTKRCGRFTYPCVGDYIWISFEKDHPYAPVYTGFATPTRRKFYPLPSIYGKTPVPVDEKSEETKQPTDYDEDYLPKDERPMSHGWQDRYGNLDIHNATGFFPIEHTVALPPPDADQLTKSKFSQSQSPPEINNPDSKMMARITKYGMIMLQADIGYKWKKKGGELDAEQGALGDRTGDAIDGGEDDGEFTGDFEEDEEFEVKRWLYMQRLLHEDEPTGHDQRRIMNLTRYGHKFEMRDVGWNKTREKEWWDDKRTIGDGEDERWVKIRTKGGHLIQSSDIGFDPEYDEFVKKLLVDEAKDTYLDKEDQYPKKKTEWNQYGDRDMRMLRFVTRSGIKMVLDDRESHDGGQYRLPSDSAAPSRLNEEIGIGILFKGRATPGTKHDTYEKLSGSPKGHFWQFDERPDHNSTSWGTPMGQVMGMDDNEELLVLCSRLPDLVKDWKNLEDNEFLTESIRSQSPTKTTHHLVIDHENESIRFKSRAGQGSEASRKPGISAASGEHAGIEVRDAPADDPWMEILDIDKRGIWFSRQDGLGIWRAKEGSNIYIWLDDNNNNIILRNATSGKVQIYCQGNVEIKADQVVGIEGKQINMKADSINLQAKSKSYTFGSTLETNADIKAPNVYARFPTAEKPLHPNGFGTGTASGGGTPVANLIVEGLPARQQPSNRL